MSLTEVAGGIPITFDATLGFLHPGSRDRGVLMCGPWGYEALSIHKSWRQLAGAAAGQGLPCLRFDYPGTGDALGDHRMAGVVEGWIGSIVDAAALLRREAGVGALTLCGFGIGALLMTAAARRIDGVTDLVLIAPPVNGREYARGLVIRGHLVREQLAIPVEPDEDAGEIEVAGHRLSSETVVDLKALKYPAALPASIRRVLVLDRPGIDTAPTLQVALGPEATLDSRVFDEYERVTADSTTARASPGLIAEIAAWIAAGGSAPNQAAQPHTVAQPLVGPHFVETPVRFGPEQRLFGVYCAAPERAPGATVLLLNNGRNRHTGWARVSVETARALAADGIASFRIDMAGVGDGVDHSAQEVLYSPEPIRDVQAALDWLAGRSASPVVLAGFCSGAFLALLSAVEDPRVKGLIAVNLQRLVLDPDEDFDKIMTIRVLTVGRASIWLSRSHNWKRLLRGDIALRRIVTGALAGLRAGLLDSGFVRRLWPWSKEAKLHREVTRRFQALNGRKVQVVLVASADDASRLEIARYFGKAGPQARFAHAEVAVLDGADHNLTPKSARAAFLAITERVVATVRTGAV